jgi:ubiquinone/menaquinone biosynthesis C-methylase UbiE
MKPRRDPEGIEIEYLEWTESVNGRQVLEIGCGDGRLIDRYARGARLVFGIDPDEEKLADVPDKGLQTLATPVFVAQAQAEDLPFAGNTFETVLLGWSL